MVLIFTLPLTRSCWEITKLSLVPYGNEAVHVDELEPDSKSTLMNTGGTLLNILWLIFFGWWLCVMHIAAGIAQCLTLIGIPVGMPPSPSGRSDAGSCRWQWPAPRGQPTPAAVFRNKDLARTC